jgi:hypothetical protein
MKRAIVGGLLLVLFGCGGGDGDDGGSLLEGEIVFDGPAPALVPVTYTSTSGSMVTVDEALEGWVTVFADAETELSQVQSAAEAFGGEIVEAIPKIGLYTVEAPPEDVPAVIAGIRDESFIEAALPSVLASNHGISVLDLEWTVEDLGDPHGVCVEAVASRSGASIERLDASNDSWWNLIRSAGLPVLRRVRMAISAAEGAAARGERQVIVSTIGSFSSNCPLEPDQCRSFWKWDWAPYINLMTTGSSHVRDNTIIVQSAGNVGLDITGVLSDLSSGNQPGWQVFRVVGATEYLTNGDTQWNYATEHMLFAPAQNVQAGGCVETGTSFAAPEIARTLEEVWREYPSLTSTELLTAFDRTFGSSISVGADPALGRTVEFYKDFKREACRIAEECPPIDYVVCSWDYLPDPMQPISTCAYTDSGNCDLQGGAPISVTGDTGTAIIELDREAIFPHVATWNRTQDLDRAIFGLVAPSPVSSIEYGDYDIPGSTRVTGHPVRSPPLDDYGMYVISFQAMNPFRYAQVEFVLGEGYTTADCDRSLH